ncbi:MAG: hypothetical protein H6Q72_2360 [Firmicutes bacterium]|nr:hypothetical protein [Bacillota bacterium]
MVTKVMPIFHVELTNRDPRNTSDGAKKKSQENSAFKEIFIKQLATVTRR